ncbi:MAG: hypothetical protein U9R72_10805 [Chloroflexota bacterium]|nr:hypothetical protein [Chloroflexota bacterium]
MNLAQVPLELADDAQEGMGLGPAAEGGVLGAVGAQEEDPPAPHLPRQVEEEVDGAKIDPLGVVDDEDEGAALGEGRKDAGELLEERGLPDADLGRAAGRRLDQGLELLQPLGPDAAVKPGQREQVPAGDEPVDQVGPVVEELVDGGGERLPDAPAVLRADAAGEHGPLPLAAEHAGDVEEREVGVALAGEGIALPPAQKEPGVVGEGAAGELGQEGGLAAARFPGDELDGAAAGGGPREGPGEGLQLGLAVDEEGRLAGTRGFRGDGSEQRGGRRGLQAAPVGGRGEGGEGVGRSPSRICS